MAADMVTVAFACNDDHGNDTGRTEAVHLVSDEHGNVNLCCQMPRGQALKRVGPMEHLGSGHQYVSLHLGRRVFAAKGWTHWYGNMAWDATRVTFLEAQRILRYLLACGYTVEGYDDGPFARIIEEHEAAPRAPESGGEGDGGGPTT